MVIINAARLSEEVQAICFLKNIEYIDAVIYWCEENNIEVEQAAELIKQDMVMLSKIEIEAENLNYLKKISRLPV